MFVSGGEDDVMTSSAYISAGRFCRPITADGHARYPVPSNVQPCRPGPCQLGSQMLNVPKRCD